jgi:hypothetical protein
LSWISTTAGCVTIAGPPEALMLKLSEKEVNILRFVRRSRHRTTIQEIANGLGFAPSEVEVFVQGMVQQQLLNETFGSTPVENAYYTNPEKREQIYELIG